MKHLLINSLIYFIKGRSMKTFIRTWTVLVVAGALFIGIPVSAMQQGAYELKQKTIMTAYGLGKVGVLHDKEGFKVKQNGKISKVHNYDLDHSLRNIDSDRLAQLEKMGGCLLVKKFDNGDFKLVLSGRLNGGGPVAGWMGYWGVKVGSYVGICVGTAATATVASGLVVTSAPVVAIAGGTLATTGTLTGGTAFVAGALGSTGTIAGVGIGAGIQSASIIASTAVAVESASTSVGLFLLACPFLP